MTDKLRILLVEDDPVTSAAIVRMLHAVGMEIDAFTLGAEGIVAAGLDHYGFILLDLVLPDMTAFDILKSIRGSGVTTGVMVLGGSAAVANIVLALGLGADDYLIKPFHRDELVARIHAVRRRCEAPVRQTIAIGDMVIDLDSKTVAVGGRQVHITNSEYDILTCLARRCNSVVSKEMLYSRYGQLEGPSIKTLDVFICHLRKKLGIDGCIETVWGRGYMMRK